MEQAYQPAYQQQTNKINTSSTEPSRTQGKKDDFRDKYKQIQELTSTVRSFEEENKSNSPNLSLNNSNNNRQKNITIKDKQFTRPTSTVENATFSPSKTNNFYEPQDFRQENMILRSDLIIYKEENSQMKEINRNLTIQIENLNMRM
jgi:hypothetical protein